MEDLLFAAVTAQKSFWASEAAICIVQKEASSLVFSRFVLEMTSQVPFVTAAASAASSERWRA